MKEYKKLPGRRIKKNSLPDSHFANCLKKEQNPQLIYDLDNRNIYNNKKIESLIDKSEQDFNKALEQLEQANWDGAILEISNLVTPKGNCYIVLELVSLVAQTPCGSKPSIS